jgi:hypothetical protein
LEENIIKVKGKVFAAHAMTACTGVELSPHPFLTFTQEGGEWLTSRLSRFISEKKPVPIL